MCTNTGFSQSDQYMYPSKGQLTQHLSHKTYNAEIHFILPDTVLEKYVYNIANQAPKYLVLIIWIHLEYRNICLYRFIIIIYFIISCMNFFILAETLHVVAIPRQKEVWSRDYVLSFPKYSKGYL